MGDPPKPGTADDDDDRADHAEAVAATDDAGDIDSRTLTLYGGGTLIFDEYGRLKYHVSNDVLHPKRQSERLADLVRFGDFRVSRQGSLAAKGLSLSAIHRLRSLDGSRLPGEGW